MPGLPPLMPRLNEISAPVFLTPSAIHMKFTIVLLAAQFLTGSTLLRAEEAVAAACCEAPAAPPGMVMVPGGVYTPLYAKQATQRTSPPCFLSVSQVTNGEFLEFVREHPEWQRSKVDRSLADESYLSHWAGDLNPGPDAAKVPVTYVSWFAARAYASARGLRLPTQDEWEFAARADATRIDASRDHAFLKKVLEWYSQPNSAALPAAGAVEPNVHGLRGLHGVVWEWVADFNSSLIAGDSRGDDSLERKLFCGSGALLASDVSNYAAFMRYAFRASLRGNYCVGSLGFRTARSLSEEIPVPVAAGQPWSLTSRWTAQDGKETALSSLTGKVRVVTMGFTSCQYACPRIVSDMQRIETALGTDADKIGFVFISLDTVRDTPEKMSAFAAERRIDLSRWTFLRGEPDSVRDLAVALSFKYQEVGGDFAHSNLIAVLDDGGHIVHREEMIGSDPAASVESIRKLLSAPKPAAE